MNAISFELRQAVYCFCINVDPLCISLVDLLEMGLLGRKDVTLGWTVM